MRKSAILTTVNLLSETRKGRLCLSLASWGKDIQALRNVVVQHASQAKTREWAVQGTRTHDEWPKVFRCNTRGKPLGRMGATGHI